MTTPLRRLMRFAYRWQGAVVLFAIVFLVMVPGAWRFQVISDNQDQQIQRNKQVVSCLVAYTVQLTDALRQRDGVAATQRAALAELDTALIEVLQAPSQRTVDEAKAALVRHRHILGRLTNTAVANPYPAIERCLQ